MLLDLSGGRFVIMLKKSPFHSSRKAHQIYLYLCRVVAFYAQKPQRNESDGVGVEPLPILDCLDRRRDLCVDLLQ